MVEGTNAGENASAPAAVDPLAYGAAVELVAALRARGETVACAESLTAGLACAIIAGVPGASAVLRGGVVVYATDLKAELAGVPPEVLAQDGPVAASTARALASGARVRCGATWGVGLTGVAGPDGQDGHPVGTVFLGIVGPGTSTVTPLSLSGDRWSIRWSAACRAVDGLLERLGGER